MSEYVVSSDNIDGKEQSRIDALCSALEKKGHTCTKRGVGPNTIQSYGLGSQSSGKIGVFIVGGSDAGMYADFVAGLKNGYYHYKEMWAVFASETATTDKWITCNGLANTPLVRAWDDNYSGSNIESVGQTAKAYFEANKQYIHYACGKLGCTFDDVIQNFLEGGGMDSDGDEGSSASSIKEAIKEVMSAWDGEVEAYVRDMKMYIHKIKLPEQDCNLILSEGLNIESKSISVKDYCPNNTNKLVVHWNGGEDITIQDNTRIERFGEKVKEVDAIKRVLSENNSTKKTVKTESTDSTTSTEEESSSDKGYEEVPAETYEEALEFAHLEWNKCKREDCHEIELSTAGSAEWQQGRWVRVYIPSFDIDGYYYISRVSENMSPTEWKASLTLVDYPPSFGEPEEESDEEESEDEETSEVSDDVTSQ